MKRLAASLLACLMLCCMLTSCGMPPEEESSAPFGEASSLKDREPGEDETPQQEMRAVWITYYEISMKAQKGGDESLLQPAPPMNGAAKATRNAWLKQGRSLMPRWTGCCKAISISSSSGVT